MYAWIATLAVGHAGDLSATSATWTESLSLVDQLGWAASDRDVQRYWREALTPDSLYSRSFRPQERSHASRLDEPTLYAVEATLIRQSDPRHPAGQLVGVALREAVVYHNPTPAPLELLVFRVFANGQDVHRDQAVIQGVWVDNRPVEWILDGTLLVVALPRPLAPRDSARVLLELQQRVPWFEPSRSLPRTGDHREVFLTEQTGAYGWSGGRINLGFWLPLITPVSRQGRFDVRPLRENTEHAWYDPALFHVVLDLPAELVVSATGVQVERRESEGRATVVGVASAVRDYTVVLGKGMSRDVVEVAGTRLQVTWPADQPELGRDLRSHAEGALRTFTDLYGPLAAAELDVVESPSRVALGIEFPGLVTIDGLHKHPMRQYVPSEGYEWTVAHEVAHQWWSAEVGNDPGEDPWLDEGLANHAAALYWERKYGRDALLGRWDAEVLAPYRELRSQGSPDLPADLPAWRYDLPQYSTMVYGRASLFFDRARELLGPDAFVEALRAYYREHRAGNVEPEDLLDALRAHADDPEAVDALHRRWIAEGHGFEDLLE